MSEVKKGKVKKGFIYAVVAVVAIAIFILLYFLFGEWVTAYGIIALVILVKVLVGEEEKKKKVKKIIILFLAEFILAVGVENIRTLISKGGTGGTGETVQETDAPKGNVAEADDEEGKIEGEVSDSDAGSNQETDEPTTTPNPAHRINTPVLDYYGSETWKGIKNSRRKMSIGDKVTFVFSTKNPKFSRHFDVHSDGVVSLTVRKNKEDSVELRDTDDWNITIIKNKIVIYEGTVNRMDEAKTFDYELEKGTYVVVIQRIAGNAKHRNIDIETTFHAKE